MISKLKNYYAALHEDAALSSEILDSITPFGRGIAVLNSVIQSFNYSVI